MIPAEILFTFFGTAILLALVPGPDNIFVLTQSVDHGSRAGLFVTLGLCSGLLVHTAAVALGVAAIFQASNSAFVALKILGALYLLYLAWQSFRAPSSKLVVGRSEALPLAKLYRRGIVMNITNPKVSIFFLAFLPQFTDPLRGPVALQMILLGFAFIVAAALTFTTISLCSGVVAGRLKTNTAARTVLDRIAGFVFAGLAIRLALSKR